ncbi:MAG: thiol:disulfide interchange protein DsbA/DsbL [Aggregatibacter aphrophilus]|uniref:thiol:disulfide interchange protein DsbA/DsbL n=1 Tax=Aggregatibacter aphrophilus TaxID=732 RepID=UPI00290CDE4C|nr:thiol:disulfide interchange protein DsbA/DsbL [Aggregatibacter aphrophilus]MDU7785697.1 thiol:disulfide interchange protein DsbA/DsbL [Aggregatibacter aphrophilus]
MLRVGSFIILLCVGHVAFAQHEEAFSTDSPRQLLDDETIQFEDGKDYFSYVEPVSFPPRSDHKILIEFFFDYDCRVCSSAQDVLDLYEQINRDKVALVEHPVATAKARFSANVFYTLQHLDAENVSSALMFETSEKTNYIRLSQMDNLLPWLENQGVERSKFLRTYHSEKVKRDVDYAIHLTEDYGVFTFPYVVINGKYVLTASTLYNDDYALAVLDYLINKKE